MRRSLTTLTFCLALAATAVAQRPPAAPSPPAPPAPPIAPMEIADGITHVINAEIARAVSDTVGRRVGDAVRGRINAQIGGGNYLGIYVDDLTSEVRTRLNLPPASGGVLVTEVATDSPATRGGLRKDDVILRVDAEAVTSAAKLTRLVTEAAPESKLRLTVFRAGGEQEVTVTLDRRSGSARLFDERFGGARLRAVPAPNAAEIERLTRAAREQQGALQALRFGNSRRLGITTVPVTKQLADYFDVKTGRGLLVTSVAETSAAARAGIKAGDVLIEVGDTQVGSNAELTREVNRRQGGEVELKIVRDRRERTIKATPERSRDSSFNFEGFAPGEFFDNTTRLLPPPAPHAVRPVAPPAPRTLRVPPAPVFVRPATPRGRIL